MTATENGDGHRMTLLPNVYDVQLPFRQRLDFYYDGEILDVPPNEVETQLKSYISEQVGHCVPLKSLAQFEKPPHNYLVAVTAIAIDCFRALIQLDEPFLSDAPEEFHDSLKAEFNEKKQCEVDIWNLFPVGDSTENHLGHNYIAAMAIEHIRFFYGYVWRPEDLADESGELYSTKYVTERLIEAYGMDRDVLPEESIEHIVELLGNVPRKGEFSTPNLKPETETRIRTPNMSTWLICIALFGLLLCLSYCSCYSPINTTLLKQTQNLIHFLVLGQLSVIEMSCEVFQGFLIESILIPFLFINLLMAFYAVYIAWKIADESKFHWFLQTIVMGVFSLRLLQRIHNDRFEKEFA